MSRPRQGRPGWRLIGLLVVLALMTTAVIALAADGLGGGREALKPTTGEPHESGEAEEINARDEWFYGQRAFPSKQTPSGAMKRAQAQARRIGRDIAGPQGTVARPEARRSGRTPAAPTTSPSWTSIGPQPIDDGDTSEYNGVAPFAGRVTAIAPHPTDSSIAYLGGAAGGVWKTTDDGADWTPVFDRQASLAIGAIGIDPQDGNTLYVGTGEANFCCQSYFGTGIYKSADGGSTWSNVGGSTFDSCHVADIVVQPGSSETVFAAVHAYGITTTGCDSGVYRSLDGGANWTKVDFGPVTDLAVKPESPDVWYAAYNASGIWRSLDGGDTWSKLGGGFPTANVGRIALAVTPANPSRVYAAVGDSRNEGALGLWTSSDSGSTWTALPYSNFCGYTDAAGGGQCGYDLALAAYPANESFAYAGGIRVQRYDGANWTTLGYGETGIHVDIHAVTFDAANRLWVGSDGGVYRKDSGQPFVNLNGSLSLTQFEPGTAGSPGGRLTGGTQDNGTLSYEAGAGSWYEFSTGDGGYSAIDPADQDVVYSSYINATVSKSTNGGADNTCVFTADEDQGPDCLFSTTDATAFYTPLEMDPANAQRLYIGTNRIWRTVTGGTSWLGGTAFPGTISAIGVAKSSPLTLYAAWLSNPTVIRRSPDAGVTWTGTGALPNRVITHIEVDPSNAAVAYATLSGFNASTAQTPGHLFKTTNSGATWTDISGNLPDSPANAVAVDYRTSPATLYVGTDVGVFWSVDGGTTWVNTSNGLPNTVVMDVRVDLATNTLIAATHGRGMYTAPVPTTSTGAGGGGGGGAGGGGGGGGGSVGADRTPPSIFTLQISPTVFRAARRGASVAVAIGTTVKYRLSETARISFRVARFAGIGRRVGRRCRPTMRKNHTRPRCRRYKLLRGGFAHAGHAGTNSFGFTGRLRRRKLRAGHYRLIAGGRDPAGNRAPREIVGFHVVR